jgi:surface carbohydrate biosynthesis protein (TIGR04326 family)
MTLHIYDSSESIDEDTMHVMLWSQAVNSNKDNHFSITKILDDNSDDLKRNYLSLISKIGNVEVNGRSFKSRLSLNEHFSFWWMSAMAKKCHHSSSSHVADTLKIMAFASWIQTQSYTHVELHCLDNRSAKVLGLKLKKVGIGFSWGRENLAERIFRRKLLSNLALPHFIAGLWFLFWYVWSRRALIGVGVRKWSNALSDSLIVSYSDNVDAQYLAKRQFYSSYWETLPETIESLGSQISFLHMYDPDKNMPSPKLASEKINALNENGDRSQIHTFLDSFLNLDIVAQCLFDWFKINIIALRMRKAVSQSCGDSWLLMEEDFYKSFFGFFGLKNLLLYKLFSRALSLTCKKANGFYLQENQGWEFGFVNAWRKAGHDQLIGVVHVPLAYWDLRMTFDSRSYVGAYPVPLPDFIGVNNRESLELFKEMSLPTNVIPVEALRYLHLLDGNSPALQTKPRRRRLLALGDYMASKTEHMLNFLQSCPSHISSAYELVIKFHPNTQLSHINVGLFSYSISELPISELLIDCDVAFTSDSSSSALDAYCKGLKVITLRDLRFLNLSPLHDAADVYFVASRNELIRALDEVVNYHRNEILPDYFYLEKTLPRWKSLLTGGGSASKII